MSKYEELINRSKWLRNEVFEMVVRQGKGHIPSSFSCVEIIVALFYGKLLKHSSSNPNDPNRDRIFISKGHASPVLYPVLADRGYFSKKELGKFTGKDNLLRFYADPSIPGIEAITGSLGHGFGIAAGHSFVSKKENRDFNSFVLLGDGECYEGSNWETAMFASHHKLDNLIVIVDRNKLCILDETENCVRLGSLENKFQAFDFDTVSVDAHSYEEVVPALESAVSNKNGRPKAIIAESVKGKGISFMEGRHEWHNRMPNLDQVNQARNELQLNCIER